MKRNNGYLNQNHGLTFLFKRSQPRKTSRTSSILEILTYPHFLVLKFLNKTINYLMLHLHLLNMHIFHSNPFSAFINYLQERTSQNHDDPFVQHSMHRSRHGLRECLPNLHLSNTCLFCTKSVQLEISQSFQREGRR